MAEARLETGENGVRPDLERLEDKQGGTSSPRHSLETLPGSIDEIFTQIAPSLPKPLDPITPKLDRIYPEILLQLPEAEHANKHMAAFQRYHRQFVDSSGEGAVIRWRDSNIETLQGLIIEQGFMGTKLDGATANGTGDRRRAYARPTSSALFSWSSNEAYIERRRRELVQKGRRVSGSLASNYRDDNDNDNEKDEIKKPQTLIDKVHVTLPLEDTLNKLSQLIETESNKFIHSRIQVIKAHHSDQISQQINERKRKDHELHLHRLKLKEEQYERELRAATEEKEKSTRFLGIFNFNTTETVVDGEGDRASVASTADLRSEKTDKGTEKKTDKEKKRFSFLPKTNIFGTLEKRKNGEDKTEEDKIEEEGRDEEEEDKIEEKGKDGEGPEPDPVPGPGPGSGSGPVLDLQLNSEDLDLVFKSHVPTPDVDEFEEFQSSPSPKPSKPPEKIITSHRFLPMSEPTPLINLEEEDRPESTPKLTESTAKSTANSADHNSTPSSAVATGAGGAKSADADKAKSTEDLLVL